MFLRALLAEGIIFAGTILVMDNAAVHNDNPDTEVVFDELSAAGVIIRKMPTYSPELNPCELVFGHVKKTLTSKSDAIRDGTGRTRERPFPIRLMDALGTIDQMQMARYYNKCRRAEVHLR